MPSSDGEADKNRRIMRACQDERVLAARTEIRKWLRQPAATEAASPRTDILPPEDCTTPPYSEEPSKVSGQDGQEPSIPSVTHIDKNEQPARASPSIQEGPLQGSEHALAVPDGDGDGDGDDESGALVSGGSTEFDDDVDGKSEHLGSAHDAVSSKPLVAEWLTQRFDPPRLSIAYNVAQFFARDIDTRDGALLPAIKHPNTLTKSQDGPSRHFRDLAWRQAHMSSELHIQREIHAREKIAQAVRSQVEEASNHLTWKERHHEEAGNEAEKAVEGEPEVAWPKANCIIRPVKEDDFAQIADIMTLENVAPECPQIVEFQKTIRPPRVSNIVRDCRDSGSPFVVAVSPDDELLDRSKWPKGAEKAYHEFLAWKREQPKAKNIILGFAFVQSARFGAGSRFSCQVRMAVHPNHRRAKIGSALLDRILLSVAPFHKSQVDYTWRCDHPCGVYEALPSNNRRQYNWIYVESLIPASERYGKAREAHAWRGEMLGGFGFQEAARFEDAVMTSRGYESEWMDLSLWALNAQPASNLHDRPLSRPMTKSQERPRCM